MFDRPLHQEALFCTYLSRLLPEDMNIKIVLEASLKLELYKLEHMNNQFPKFFEETAQEAYMESTERFTKMFKGKARYMAIMNAVNRECRNSRG